MRSIGRRGPEVRVRAARAVGNVAVVTLLGLAGLALIWTAAANASRFVVTNANARGPGSLRAAIDQANLAPGADVIDFAIGSGSRTITPRRALPAVTSPVVIDGTTQPGFSGTPLIKLDGSHVRSRSGLVIRASSSTVRGLEIIGWSNGIVVVGARDVVIGGSQRGDGNVISGNHRNGLDIYGAGAKLNLVEGNYIGTNEGGTRALGNRLEGIAVHRGAANNTIGGPQPVDRNVISGNHDDGVDIFAAGAVGNVVLGDYIGTDATGAHALGNRDAGVAVYVGGVGNRIGGPLPGDRNVISANRQDGIDISDRHTRRNLVEGDFIGTDATGTHALGNRSAGVALYHGSVGNTIGGSQPGDRNVISANLEDGVDITDKLTRLNAVRGNYVGTDVTGTRALGNRIDGVDMYGGASGNTIGGSMPPDRNVISGNRQDGVDIYARNTRHNSVEGNYIGTDVTGDRALANRFEGVSVFGRAFENTIGGPRAGDRNVISANGDNGVNLFGRGTRGNRVQGNYLGTNAAGTGVLGNRFEGVFIHSGPVENTIGGSRSGDRNVISGNHQDGADLADAGTRDNRVEGNYIGTNATGARALGNRFEGVDIFRGAVDNTIGGRRHRDRNVISANHGDGVDIDGTRTRHNVVRGNYLGIDATGRHALGNSFEGVAIYEGAADNAIGGPQRGDRNVISGNHDDGVDISEPRTRRNVVQGNYIGIDATGVRALGNHDEGVAIFRGPVDNTIGGSQAGDGNVISANHVVGVYIFSGNSTGNRIAGNHIGTDANGRRALGKQFDGVLIFAGARDNVIGGRKSGARNVIANSTRFGVEIRGNNTVGDAILGDALFANGSRGIALRLGANRHAPAPTISRVSVRRGSMRVSGTVNRSGSHLIEVFANPSCSNAEGKRLLASVTTSSSTWSVNVERLPASASVTATATDMQGDTSQFSSCKAT